jgi:hypothetical protein
MISLVNIETIGVITLHARIRVVFLVTCHHISLLEKEIWATQGKDG